VTPQELRAALATLLADLLGTYKTPQGTTVPACRVGDPPPDWTATGVEVIVDPALEFDNRPLHQHTAVITEIPVRVVQHGTGSPSAVAARIAQRFNATNPTQVPANERLGILAQYTLRVRS